nr:uncharacterized mitochondrial protein AtMg00810-like [Tanacetum cinerariifolium]
TGPTWLFDIDSLTRTMNYQPVIVGNQSNPSAGFQENFNAGKTGEEVDQEYMLFLVWSTGSTNPHNREGDATIDAVKPESTINLSPSSRNRDFNKDFKDYSEDSSNDVSAASPIVPTAGLNYSNITNSISATGPIVSATGYNYSNNTNPISAAGPSNSNSSPTHRQSSLRYIYLPPDMVEREDIVYYDHENVGAEAGFNNLETSITVSPIPTTRTHNAHLISQIIEEEVYVCQPLGFEDPDHPDKVYKVVKAHYGLHQAPRAWYETLAHYLLKNGFHRGQIDQTLFIKKQKGNILLVQIYVDDIIFVKRIFRYLKGKPNLGLWYPKDLPFDLVAYSDSDYAGAILDRKSTTGGCQFLRSRLISWQCKKQTIVATSSTEAEYVAGASCCA